MNNTIEYPKEIYITVEEPNTENEYFLAHKNPSEFAVQNEVVEAAVYKLVKTVNVKTKTTTSVVSSRKRKKK